MEARIRSMAASLAEKAQGYREHMHRYPELSFQEHTTMQYVAEQLDFLGIPYQKGVGNTGVVAHIFNSKQSPEQSCFGLRSELDALPIPEQTGAEYASQHEGIMHACGHDVHTSILLATAELLWTIREDLPQPVKLIFQPGEEKNPGGASILIKEGVLNNPPVHGMAALHVYPEMEAGKVGFKEGLYMASCDELYLTIHGKGGHGAMPHQTVDPIMVGAQLLVGLQQVVSRNCDPKIPCVLSFGHFEALGATNVIPDSAYLKGTFRTMNEEWREKGLGIIERHVHAVCEQFGATATFEVSKGYPMLNNDPELTRRVWNKAIEFLGEDRVEELPLRLTSEDFSFYAQEIPVCFFRLGVRNEERGIVYGVHHPKFDVDPRCFETGIQLMSLAVFA